MRRKERRSGEARARRRGFSRTQGHVIKPGGAGAAQHGAQSGTVCLLGAVNPRSPLPIVGPLPPRSIGEMNRVLAVANVIPASGGKPLHVLRLTPMRASRKLRAANEVDAALSGGDPGRLGAFGPPS